MRIKLSARTIKPINIPYNYQYVLHSAIYNLIRKSSGEYSRFLHDTGFIDENKHLKLFTFSKLQFHEKNRSNKGFKKVKQIELYFSTPIPKNFEHIVLGIFSDQKLELNFGLGNAVFDISIVETLPEINFSNEMRFSCLSPIAISTMETRNDKLRQHFLDYMNPQEREHFTENLRKNLIRKFRIINGKEFVGSDVFEFSFDPVYITKRNGKISKLIDFKNGIKIKAMEAPFAITADKELIKIGYECGFGEKNSAGFGMVREIG